MTSFAMLEDLSEEFPYFKELKKHKTTVISGSLRRSLANREIFKYNRQRKEWYLKSTGNKESDDVECVEISDDSDGDVDALHDSQGEIAGFVTHKRNIESFFFRNAYNQPTFV